MCFNCIDCNVFIKLKWIIYNLYNLIYLITQCETTNQINSFNSFKFSSVWFKLNWLNWTMIHLVRFKVWTNWTTNQVTQFEPPVHWIVIISTHNTHDRKWTGYSSDVHYKKMRLLSNLIFWCVTNSEYPHVWSCESYPPNCI